MLENGQYRLADSTAIEPLVNRWVAWPHLMPPVAGSLHLRNYQIKLLEAYLKDPAIHAEACLSPKLRSGPFMDIKPERAGEIKDFLARTEVELADNLKFAASLFEFHNFLVAEAKGQSLEPFYEKLPEVLRGYVELNYDYYNRPFMRCLEGLLYESPYYKKSLQSLRIFEQTNDSARPFFQNTPRLKNENQIEWNVAFDSPEVDELFKLADFPRPLGEIRDLLGLKPSDESLLQSLLTEEPVPPRERWESDTVRIRAFGHACALIEWKGISVLVDPCLSVSPSEGGMDRFTYRSLPEKIDYVLITHIHQDHFAIETLLRLRHKVGCLVVPRSTGVFWGDISLKALALKIGFKHVVEVDALDSLKLPGGEIVAVPFMGEHADLAHSKSAYLIRAGHEQILFGADSDCLDRRMYQHLRRILGPIQTVFLGLECVGAPLTWSCGPFLPVKPEFSHDQSRRYHGCDSSRALEILGAVGARRIYIYAMGLEPWMEYLLGLAYTEDAKQIKEARKLIGLAPSMGIDHAELLFGKREILLDNKPSRELVAGVDAATTLAEASQMEDQFAFV